MCVWHQNVCYIIRDLLVGNCSHWSGSIKQTDSGVYLFNSSSENNFLCCAAGLHSCHKDFWRWVLNVFSSQHLRVIWYVTIFLIPWSKLCILGHGNLVSSQHSISTFSPPSLFQFHSCAICWHPSMWRKKILILGIPGLTNHLAWQVTQGTYDHNRPYINIPAT